jgi:hypothetical protein
VNPPPEPTLYTPPPPSTEPSPEREASEAGRDAAIPLSALLEKTAPKVREIGGRQNGLDPTRYGDWEKNGRCIDF